MGRIACIDFGLVHFGLAISDEKKIIAFPLEVLKGEKSAAATIQKILARLSSYELEEIVIGYPLKLSGKVGHMADEVLYFVQELKKATSIPIVLLDERLTTAQALKSLQEGSMSRKKRSAVIDAVTAAILLQNHLDMKSLAFNR